MKLLDFKVLYPGLTFLIWEGIRLEAGVDWAKINQAIRPSLPVLLPISLPLLGKREGVKNQGMERIRGHVLDFPLFLLIDTVL